MEYSALERWTVRNARKARARWPAPILFACALAVAIIGIVYRNVDSVAPVMFFGIAGLLLLERQAFGSILQRLEDENESLRGSGVS